MENAFVSKYLLKAQSPLNGTNRTFEGVIINEITNRDIVSIATPSGGKDALSGAVRTTYQATLPTVGQWTGSSVDNAQFLGMTADQYFVVFDHSGSEPQVVIERNLGHTGYFTDQSDSWVIIKIGGPKCRSALERICSIDLHPTVFPEGSVSRTLMEHLGTIILSERNNDFLLLSARSSAKSFLQTIQESVENIL